MHNCLQKYVFRPFGQVYYITKRPICQELFFRHNTSKYTKKGEQVPFYLVKNFDYYHARPQVYQRSVQVMVALPLAAESVEPLVEPFERRSLQVGAGGVDLAEGVDEKSVVVAVVGVDVCGLHNASYVCGRSLPYFYDTIIPQKRQKVKNYFLDVIRLNPARYV